MDCSYYGELDKLIIEQEEDSRIIKADSLIMKNYPKVFVMSSASLFEHNIKGRCQDFLDSPIKSIQSEYPLIERLKSKQRNKPLVDKMFAELKGYENNGVEILSAESFYELFGGETFKQEIKSCFAALHELRLQRTIKHIEGLVPLLDNGARYEFDYAKQCEIKERLERCSFEVAEKAYLCIKLRRNRVAHNYLYGLSDTFSDIRDFYYDAILYVVALEQAIIGLTNIDT